MPKRSYKSLLVAGLSALSAFPLTVAACGSEPFIGEICTFGFNFCPRGYQQAAGQLLPINQNQALFSLLGTTYGGDGRTTFALPDLRGRSPIGEGQGPGLSIISLGEQGGTESVTLSSNNMPSHSHAANTSVTVNSTVNAVSGGGNSISPSGALWATSTSRDSIYSSSGANTTLSANAISTTSSATTSIGSTGGGQPFANRSPFLGVTYCIATQGIFPSRP